MTTIESKHQNQMDSLDSDSQIDYLLSVADILQKYGDDNIEKCYTKQNEIAKEISLIFKNAERIEDDVKFPWDPTGKSHIFHKKFILNSGDVIYVSCSEYERNLKIENGWTDGLSVSIKAGEVVSWLQNHIN